MQHPAGSNNLCHFLIKLAIYFVVNTRGIPLNAPFKENGSIHKILARTFVSKKKIAHIKPYAERKATAQDKQTCPMQSLVPLNIFLKNFSFIKKMLILFFSVSCLLFVHTLRPAVGTHLPLGIRSNQMTVTLVPYNRHRCYKTRRRRKKNERLGAGRQQPLLLSTGAE